MSAHWPRVEARISVTFDADHSLPQMGFSRVHRHSYWLEAGWCHEINPDFGATKSMVTMKQDLDAVIDKIKGKNLNDVLPVTPTAEWLACWVLAQLPPYWNFVVVRCYGGFECRVDRHWLNSAWTEKLRVGAA